MATLMFTLNMTTFRSIRQHPTRFHIVYKALRLSALAGILTLLFGCGSGTEAVDAAGKTVNSFARNAVDANEEIAQNGTSNITACTGTDASAVTYCLVVEATDSMIASWQTEVFNLITPAKAYAFRGLTTVPARSIEIIQVDHNLNRISSEPIPSYTVTDNPALGTYSINFSQPPSARIDIIAKVTLDNGQVLLAPFIDSSIDENFNPIVVVNVVSDFLVKQLYGKLNSADALNSLLPCNGGTSNTGNNVDCTKQPFAKFSLWNALNELTQGYEIDIPADYTITQALELLDSTSDFKAHINTVLDEMLRTEEAFVGGTERTLDLSDPQNTFDNLSTQKEYNSTLFSLAFNQVDPDSAAKGASISTTVSSKFDEISGAINYPELTLNTSNFYVTLTGLVENFPIQRRSLSFSQANDLSLSAAVENGLSSAPSNTFLTSQGFYVAGKMPYQTITDRTATTAIGWQSDPYTQLIYTADADSSGPQAMLSSFVRNGGQYAITDNGDSTWTRNDKQEEQNIFAWSSYNQALESGSGSAIEQKINSKTFGAVGLSLKLSDTGDIYTTAGDIMHWSAVSPDTITETQPSAHYQSYLFSRAADQTLNVSAPSSSAVRANRQYQATPSLKSTSSGLQNIFRGRLTVTALGTLEPNQASSTPEGDMITVIQNELSKGQGMIQAVELRDTAPTADRSNLRYRLSGNSFGSDAGLNRLRNYNNSVITLNSQTTAVLSLNILESTHDINSQVVSKIAESSITNISGTYSVASNGEVQFTFPNVEGHDLTLTGFMSKHLDDSGNETAQAGNVLTLLLTHDYVVGGSQATLGLVQALKEQTLDVKIQ